jgi:hypothetical protein
VIEWLEAIFTTQVSGDIEEMNKKASALKIRESYRTSKGITSRRYIDKKQSSQCQIEMEEVTEHFTKTWARPEQDFIEANQGSRLHLEARITDKEEDELQGFILDEEKITEVIKSRDDHSANGIDGINYRVIKGAGPEGVKFVRTLVRGITKSGRVMSLWKEAKIIPIHKKGDQELANNFNHKLYVQDIYLFDGESIPRNYFDNEDLLGHAKGIHPENERMQRTRNSLE